MDLLTQLLERLHWVAHQVVRRLLERMGANKFVGVRTNRPIGQKLS